MCTQSTAKRVRRQMRNGMAHLPKQRRPSYVKRDAETSAKRMQKRIATEQRMKQGKNK